MGLFALTGSQQFGRLSGVSQSLAGRVALLTLLPLSLSEILGANLDPGPIGPFLHRGLYPPVLSRGADPSSWYGNYVRTYIERDVRQMINIRDLSSFYGVDLPREKGPWRVIPWRHLEETGEV